MRRLQAKSKMQTAVLDDLLYADDIEKNASKERKMPEAIDRVSQACNNYVNQHEMVVLQPTPGKPCSETTITPNGQSLQIVDKFTYLGSTRY